MAAAFNNHKLILFDLDGTILDTIQDLTISINTALEQSGLPVHTEEEVLHFVGDGIPKAIERAIRPVRDPQVHAQVLKDFHAHYKVHCMDHTMPYPGIVHLLERLKDAGCLLAVVSNKADYAVQELIDLRFPGIFDTAVGLSGGMARKPAPDAVNKALHTLTVISGLSADLLKKNAVFIGDSDVDIQTARNAGMDEILVSWGFRGRDFLERCGAKRIVDSREELEELLLFDSVKTAGSKIAAAYESAAKTDSNTAAAYESGGTYRIAVCQMDSQNQEAENLKKAGEWIREAAEHGASLIAFPENMSFMGAGYRDHAQTIPGAVTEYLSELAKQYGIWIVSGSFPEQADASKVCNTLVLIDPRGQIRASYRKLHLFDIDISNGPYYRESDTVSPGSEIVTCNADELGTLGFAICYDLRFCELYRTMALQEASLILVPSCFTAHTGQMHWEILLRARAIENGVFIAAPDQIGVKSDMTAHGHSMIIDPYGRILAERKEGCGLIYADIDPKLVRQARTEIPVLENRRTDLYT